MKKLVITGGCGFIGVNLIRYLLKLKKSVQIRVVDNFKVGTMDDLARVCSFMQISPQNLKAWNSGVTLVEGDILDARLANEICQGADGVVHLAANTGVIPSIENPRMDFEANVLGTFNYLEACRLNKVQRFVLASSGAPLGEQVPPIHENMVPRPISPYGASKLCGEAYCSAYYGSFDVETVCLRFGNVYGPYSTHKGSVIAKFIKQILAGETLTIYGYGSQTRDFIYVIDLCSAIWKALTVPGIGGEVFQIATHKEHTVIEVAEILNGLMMKYTGKSSPVIHASMRKGEVQRNYSDITKAKKLLKWEPECSFEKGMEETVCWFVEHQ